MGPKQTEANAMSDPTQQPTPAEQADAPAQTDAAQAKQPTPHRKSFGDFFSHATLTQLTMLVLAAIFIWQWLDAHTQLNQTQQEVARRLSEVEAANKANQILVTQNQEQVRELGGKLSLVESKFDEMQSQRSSLEALYQELSSSRDQTALAEVEQLLIIAEQQLRLSSNVKAALIAMQQAEARLQRPAFSSLKKRIDQDIDKLRALPDVDVTAINLRLDGVIGAVDTLELAQDEQAPVDRTPPHAIVPAEGTWKRLWAEVWQELRSLVRIEDTGQQALPLLPPTQTFFLRENLKLHLLTARIALLTRDETVYRRDLKTSLAWLKRYFNTNSSQCAEAIATLQKLAATNIAVNLPDLSSSLEAVRNYQVSHERSAR
jgi:uroporphyrin-III C-methyltransferase